MSEQEHTAALDGMAIREQLIAQAWPVEQELPLTEMKGHYKAFRNTAHVPDDGKPEEELKTSWEAYVI